MKADKRKRSVILEKVENKHQQIIKHLDNFSKNFSLYSEKINV